jgi:hypothetical protein
LTKSTFADNLCFMDKNSENVLKDFAIIASAVRQVFGGGFNAEAAFGAIEAALCEYVGERSDRTASEQALYAAAYDFVYGKVKRRAIAYAALNQELSFYNRENPAIAFVENPYPVQELDIGPTITPAEWAAENPSTPEEAAILAAATKCALDPETDLPENTKVLRELLSDNDPFGFGPEHILLVEACTVFLRRAKASLMFGDSLEQARADLWAAIGGAIPVSEPSKPSIDLLGRILYIWPVEFAEDKPVGFHFQFFEGGRPTSKITKADENERVATIDFALLGNSIVIEREAPKPYLYILMRNDLASMNAGKAVAQGTHAANQMIFEGMIRTDPFGAFLDPDGTKLLLDMVGEWSREARGFGTCIVLGASERQMRASVASAKEARIHAGITHDPSYPVKDGESFYTVPLDTCAYIFDYQAVVKPHVSELSLLP